MNSKINDDQCIFEWIIFILGGLFYAVLLALGFFYLRHETDRVEVQFLHLLWLGIIFTLFKLEQNILTNSPRLSTLTRYFLLFTVSFIVILVLVYGFGAINQLGFYNDDWQRVGLFNTVKANNPLEWLYHAGKNRVLEIESRPFYRILTLPLPLLFEDNPIYYHLFKIFLISLTVVGIALFLRTFLPLIESWLLAFLAVSFPTHSAIWFWSLTDVAVFALLMLFLSLATYIKFLKTVQKRWLITTLLLFLLAITTYENTTVALPLFLVLPYFLGKGYDSSVKKSLAFLFGLVALDIFYQFIFLPKILKIPFHTTITLITSLLSLLRGTGTLLEITWGSQFWDFWVAGFAYFQKVNSAWLRQGLLVSVALGLLFGLGVAWQKTQKSLNKNMLQERSILIVIALGGILFLSSGLFMVLFNQLRVGLGTLSDRYTFLPSVGAGLSLGGLVVLVFRKLRGVAWAVFSLLVFFSLASQQFYATAYIKSWQVQREVMERVAKLRDYLGEGQKLVLFYLPPDVIDGIPAFQHYWSVVYPSQIALQNFELDADFDWGQVKDGQVIGPGFVPHRTYQLGQIYRLDFKQNKLCQFISDKEVKCLVDF